MRRKTPVVSMILCLTMVLIVQVKQVRSQSHESAIAIGNPVTTQINCSERAGGIEAYDATISLAELVRGSKALELLQAADDSNPKPDAGFEYILARIHFEMKPRGAPGDKFFDLGRPLQFTALSESLEEYTPPSVRLPEPELKGRIPANQAAEGWVAFAVKQEDKRPLLMFDPSSGGAWNRGKIVFFRLYQ